MKTTGAELIIKILQDFGIDTIAGIPGGANLPIYDALHKSNIKHILTRHEQSAGFIAQGIARTTNKPAVCLATSGPGATNLITAIADAHLDSIPIIAITGQINSDLIGKDAFQEVDIISMAKPVTKAAYFIDDVSKIIETFTEAFKTAATGRPGPVLIDIPKDIQKSEIDLPKEKIMYSHNHEPPITFTKTEIAKMINNAKNPIILAGGGIILGKAFEELRSLAEKNSIPIATTLMGSSCIDQRHPLYMGMIGMHGDAAINTTSHMFDLVIACGTRFNDRTTGKLDEFFPNSTFIHININKHEQNKIIKSHMFIQGDIKKITKDLLPLIQKNQRESLHALITLHKKKFKQQKTLHKKIFNPENIIKTINSFTDDDAIITTDVGQHQMWIAQHYIFKQPGNFLTSGGLGTMGFGLPTAMGAALANKEKTILCFTGDGSLQMNIQELATLAELNLNIKIILFDNNHLGLVRQQQQLFYKGNYSASKFQKNPDFLIIAKGFGINSICINSIEVLHDKMTVILNDQGPMLIHLPIASEYNVYPMVEPGKGNSAMIFENSFN